MSRCLALSLCVAAVAIPSAASAQSLDAASRAAFGRQGTTIRIDDENVRFRATRLVETRFGPVLLAEGRVRDFSHVSPGRIGAWYLRRVPGGYARVSAFPKAVSGGSMGGLSDWGVSTRFAANPVISAESGFTGQGITCVSTILTELTPRGPVEIAVVPTAYENAGGVGRATSIAGKIGEIVPGRSFAIRYGGSARFVDRYERRGAMYRRVGPTRFPQC